MNVRVSKKYIHMFDRIINNSSREFTRKDLKWKEVYFELFSKKPICKYCFKLLTPIKIEVSFFVAVIDKCIVKPGLTAWSMSTQSYFFERLS